MKLTQLSEPYHLQKVVCLIASLFFHEKMRTKPHNTWPRLDLLKGGLGLNLSHDSVHIDIGEPQSPETSQTFVSRHCSDWNNYFFFQSPRRMRYSVHRNYVCKPKLFPLLHRSPLLSTWSFYPSVMPVLSSWRIRRVEDFEGGLVVMGRKLRNNEIADSSVSHGLC